MDISLIDPATGNMIHFQLAAESPDYVTVYQIDKTGTYDNTYDSYHAAAKYMVNLCADLTAGFTGFASWQYINPEQEEVIEDRAAKLARHYS